MRRGAVNPSELGSLGHGQSAATCDRPDFLTGVVGQLLASFDVTAAAAADRPKALAGGRGAHGIFASAGHVSSCFW